MSNAAIEPLPFAVDIDLRTGVIEDADNHWTRRLSDMGAMYHDQTAVNKRLEREDPLIYEVYDMSVPEVDGQLLHGTSVIYPGTVGDEYFMTKGHYHARRDTGEVYFCLSGEGYLLTGTEEGDAEALPMQPGTSTYIPPYFAHRTVNTGEDPFVFYYAYPGDAGHDYGSIEQTGFPQLLLEIDGEPVLEPNPNHET